MMNKNALKIWKFRNKFVSLQRQNVVRGREQFAFGAEFKLDLSDHPYEDIAHKVMSSVFLSHRLSIVLLIPCLGL